MSPEADQKVSPPAVDLRHLIEAPAEPLEGITPGSDTGQEMSVHKVGADVMGEVDERQPLSILFGLSVFHVVVFNRRRFDDPAPVVNPPKLLEQLGCGIVEMNVCLRHGSFPFRFRPPAIRDGASPNQLQCPSRWIYDTKTIFRQWAGNGNQG